MSIFPFPVRRIDRDPELAVRNGRNTGLTTNLYKETNHAIHDDSQALRKPGQSAKGTDERDWEACRRCQKRHDARQWRTQVHRDWSARSALRWASHRD